MSLMVDIKLHNTLNDSIRHTNRFEDYITRLNRFNGFATPKIDLTALTHQFHRDMTYISLLRGI